MIGANVANAVEGIGALDTRLGQMGLQIRRFGRGLAELGLGYKAARFFEGAIGDAAAFEGEMAHVSTAVYDGAATAKELAEVQALVNRTSEEGVIASDDLAEGYYRARSTGLDHAAAMAAVADANNLVTGTARNAQEAISAYEPAARLLGDIFNDYGDKAKAATPQLKEFSDVMSLLISKYAFASPEEVIYAFEYAVPMAKAAGIAFKDMNATIALLSSGGLHGAQAGTAAETLFSNLLTNTKLWGLEVKDAKGNLQMGPTLEHLSDFFGHMRKDVAGLRLKEMGFDEHQVEALMLVLPRWRDFFGMRKDFDAAHGNAAALDAKRMAAADDQLYELANRWDELKKAVGRSLLGPLMEIVSVLKPAVSAMTAFAGTYPQITALAAGLLGAAAALITIGGVLQILGAGRTIGVVVSGVGALARVTGITGGLTRLLLGSVDAFGVRATLAYRLATAGQWLFNAACAVNPIVWIVAGIAALAIAAYEVYEHWAAVKAFFVTLGKDFYAAGKNFLTFLAQGMVEGAVAAVHAAEAIAHKIGRFFVGHSPIPEGALHDMDVGREIAKSMKPGPVIDAVRRLATAAAVALPMSLGGHGAGLAMHGGAGTAPITIHSSPRVTVTVNGGGKPAEIRDAVLAAMNEHARELATTLQRHKFNRDRGNY